MATEQGIRQSFSRRTALKNIVGLIPAVLIIAAMLNALSCGNNGLLSQGGGSVSPTATPTSTAGTLAFVTNYNDAEVSSFKRNTTTGALTWTGQVTAGKKPGPRGVVASPSGSFLYVANINDGKIYEFSINSTNGTLTPLSPASVSNGGSSGPDELAIISTASATLLWVTNAHNGTVGSYTVNTSTGQLTSVGTIGGFSTPFGITLNPNYTASPPLYVLYVSDTATGLIWPMSYNTSTGALSYNSAIAPAEHSSDASANMPAAIAIDSGGDALFIADQVLGEVSSFSIDTTTGALTPEFTFANSSPSGSDAPVGVGIAVNAGNEFFFTANSGVDSISSFLATTSTTLTVPPTVASGYNGAKGLVVDPADFFVYTADSGDGTVGQATINGTCGYICAGPLVSTESPANASSGPFGITLAN